MTRLAMLPERQFGWTREQPLVQERWMKQASMNEADVLVIGDSFSMGRIWQTALTQEGLRVRTEHWANMPAVCADLAVWLREQGFKGRHVVLQIVERHLANDVKRSLACEHVQYRSHHDVQADQPVPARHVDRQASDRSGRLSVGLKTVWQGWRAAHLSQQPGFQDWRVSSEVRMRRVTQGCERFSHPQCNDALFYAADRAEDLTESLLDDMAALGARLPGLSVTWLVVPNKTTAYFHPDKRFWDLAQAKLGSPNLLKSVRDALRTPMADLYLGNNTHFSTEGYLLMGRTVRDALRRQR